MNKSIAFCGKAACAAFLFISTADAGAQPQVGADLAWESKYLWRGLPFNEESVLWPDVWASYRGFTATLWGSIPLTDAVSPTRQITEVDYYLDYSRSFGAVETSLGYSHLTYPHTGAAQTGEFHARASADLKLFQVSLTGYFDVMDVKGIYLSPGFSRTLTWKPIEPTMALSLGYGNRENNLYWFGVDKAGWTDLNASLETSFALPGALGRWMTVKGDLNYSRILNSELAAGMMGDRNNFWFGLGLAFSTPGGD